MKKYGTNMFAVRILEEDIPESLLSERERHWIEQFDCFNNGYNLTSGGETNCNIAPEVKERISKAMTGRDCSSEQVEKMRATLKKRGANTFVNRGNGKHLRVKIKATHILTGDELVFNSITDLCVKLSMKNGNVSRALKNGYKVGEYKFERIGENSFRKPVKGYCKKSGQLKHKFDSMSMAGKVLSGTRTSGIKRALNNPGKSTWKGCYWYYENGA